MRMEPQLAGGDFVKLAGTDNEAEAEFIQGLLLEEGVPSSLRRTRGFDVPNFLAAGPHDVLVAARRHPRDRDLRSLVNIFLSLLNLLSSE